MTAKRKKDARTTIVINSELLKEIEILAIEDGVEAGPLLEGGTIPMGNPFEKESVS